MKAFVDAEDFNMSAEFMKPTTEHGAYPGVKVAGVWVNVYVDRSGRLVISADFDESELGDPTPVEVRMSGETVWSA